MAGKFPHFEIHSWENHHNINHNHPYMEANYTVNHLIQPESPFSNSPYTPSCLIILQKIKGAQQNWIQPGTFAFIRAVRVLNPQICRVILHPRTRDLWSISRASLCKIRVMQTFSCGRSVVSSLYKSVKLKEFDTRTLGVLGVVVSFR